VSERSPRSPQIDVGPRRLKLAMVSYGLPVQGQKRGGIERAAHTLADGLARRGHEVVVFTHDPKPDGAGYEVRELPWKSFVNTWLGRRVTMGFLGNVLTVLPRYADFDAVIAHGDSLLAAWAGRPVLRVMHGSARGEAASASSVGRAALQLGVYVQELASALIYREHVVGVSESTRRENPFVRRVIPHGVDERVFLPVADTRSPEPSIVFVGARGGRKRGQFLLERFVTDVRSVHPAATLTMVGVDGVTAPGLTCRMGVPDAELAALYRRAWVYASPSTYEGFGLPYLEAMACGTPVVATPNPGSREVLGDGAYGVLASDADFGPAIARLLSDAPRREGLVAYGLGRARSYSLHGMIDRYESLLVEMTRPHADGLSRA
jgi:phosphatidylinositol alpha-mannosyltransferase